MSQTITIEKKKILVGFEKKKLSSERDRFVWIKKKDCFAYNASNYKKKT